MQLEPTFLSFLYKMPLGARVENYFKVLINILFQICCQYWIQKAWSRQIAGQKQLNLNGPHKTFHKFGVFDF